MSMMIMPAAPKLGFLGFGESKEGAIAAYDAAANKLQLELKKSLEEFPKAAAALNMWPKVMAEEKQFWADRQDTFDSSKGITFWGDRIEAANKYAARWTTLTEQVVAKALELNEKPKTPGYSPFPPKKDEKSFPWAIVGGVLVLGAVIALAGAKKAGRLSGMRRRRRSR
jgi:hypothetical protein